MAYAITGSGWRAVGEDFTEADLALGETLVDDVPQWLIDKIEQQQILMLATDRLNALTRQANAQVSDLAGRVTTLDFLLNGQDEEDPDYIPPTDADVAELAQRKTQLKQWNTYNVKLGKVKSAAAWPTAPAWPAMPEIYTNETAVLSASAS